MPKFKEVYLSEPQECRNTINNIIDTYDIRDIYISIGGKINNDDNFMTHENNGIFQIIPSCFKLCSTAQLVIVFDTFTQHDYERCCNRITTHNATDTHVVLVNQYCNCGFIRRFIPYIINMSRKINCAPSNLVICNYVKFKYQPTPIEQRFLDEIPNNIYAILINPLYNDYIESFYEWFGYNAYLYNFIYKYKYYKIYRGAYSSLNLLSDTINTIECDRNYQLIVSNPQVLNFWNYVYDITRPNYKLTSIYQAFVDDGKIKVVPYNG